MERLGGLITRMSLRKWAEKALAAFPERTPIRLRQFLAEEYMRVKRGDEAIELIWQNFIKRSDQRVGDLFNDWRRSTVLGTLYQWIQEGLMKEEEFESLSEKTKGMIHRMIEPKFYRE